MKVNRLHVAAAVLASATALVCCMGRRRATPSDSFSIARRQVPSWSRADLNAYLNGTIGTECIPERVLHAWMRCYPDLYPARDLSNFGLVPGAPGELPMGVSRRPVPHLGGQMSIGINCASCHGTRIEAPGEAPVDVLGTTSHFDVEGFFGALTVAMLRTSTPEGMTKFLPEYLKSADPSKVHWGMVAPTTKANFRELLRSQEADIRTACKEDPDGSQGVAPGDLHTISHADLELEWTQWEWNDRGFTSRDQMLTSSDYVIEYEMLDECDDLLPLVRALLRLFHNIRTALHIPFVVPKDLPPPSGPGRNDAFGLLHLSLFGKPTPYAPVKFGVIWDLDHRRWVHSDGNTSTPVTRNLLGAVGLGAPIVDRHAILDMKAAVYQTSITEKIRPAKYPWAIDRAAAARGEMIYRATCASCHDRPEDDSRLMSPAEIGTDPARAGAFTREVAADFNRFFDEVKFDGFTPPRETIRSTGKYWTPRLDGVWARAPYLHNGSVPTMWDLLQMPPNRPKSWHRGTRTYDPAKMGFIDEGSYLYNTSKPGHSNSGHADGTMLADGEKKDLIEYLKTR